jgi:hypothetical protein
LVLRGPEARAIDAHGETINTQFCNRCLFVATKTNYRNAMPKAYWIAFYREVVDADKLAAYAKLAGFRLAFLQW